MDENKQIQTNLKNNYKSKKEKIFVKSNKKKKIELKNLDIIKELEKSNELDEWTKMELNKIKNFTFKNNVFDYGEKKIVSSVRLKKISKLGKNLTPLIWEYYKNRGNIDVNYLIKLYGRENLIINYSLYPLFNKKIIKPIQQIQLIQ